MENTFEQIDVKPFKKENLIIDSMVYVIAFDTENDYKRYRNCYKKVGRGEGADWVLKKGYTEQGLLNTLKKTKGYAVNFAYELGNLKLKRTSK